MDPGRPQGGGTAEGKPSGTSDSDMAERIEELRLSFLSKFQDDVVPRRSVHDVGLRERLQRCLENLKENKNLDENGDVVVGDDIPLPDDYKWGNIFTRIDEDFEKLVIADAKEVKVNKVQASIPSFRGNAFTGISYRRFHPEDIFRITEANLDPMVETYGVGFYLHYNIQFSEYFIVAEHNNNIVAYIMGKDEGDGENYHGHVTALTVVSRFRKRGIATYLMKGLEETSIRKNCYFVDLFVRKSNMAAIKLYEALGYVVYREIIDYYTGEKPENAYDMRKALPRDVKKKSVIPLKHPVHSSTID